MPEHAHLLTVPERWEYKTSKFLKSVKKGVSQHAMSFLEKQQRSDWLERLTHRYPGGKVERHFWQPGGGYDRNIVAPGAFLSSIRYIHANPLRRGLVSDPLDWEWSSARWWEGDRDVKLAMDVTSLW